MILIYWLFRRTKPNVTNRLFRRGQLISAAMYSLGHGANDAQKKHGCDRVDSRTEKRDPLGRGEESRLGMVHHDPRLSNHGRWRLLRRSLVPLIRTWRGARHRRQQMCA